MLALLTILVEALLPPAGLAAVALLLVLAWRRGRVRRPLLLVLVPLVLLSMPAVSQSLIAALDPGPAAGGPAPGAIVVLSGDTERAATPGAPDLGALTLERERVGAALARRTGLPVMVTGGVVNDPPPIALLMAGSMERDFGIRVRWIETESATTWENARFAAAILLPQGIRRVFLVTHAWHMRRSLLAFRRAGLDAVPAAVRADPWPRPSVRELVPRASAWMRGYYAIHEWVGLLWYWVRP